MKDIFKKIIEFLKDVFELIEKNEIVEEPILELPEEELIEEPIIEQVEIKQPENDLKTTSNEVYKMLTNKQRQTYLKKIGLYTKKVDNIRGEGQKKAEKQFNIIFLNINSSTYTEETDKKLREFYASYKKSKYMTDSDWAFFKNLTKKEYKCKCGGKYCNGYPHKIHKRLVMKDQYIRNRTGEPLILTSGLRCKDHNRNEGGVSNSKHQYGGASDGYCKNKTANDIIKIVKELPILNYCYAVTKKVVHSDIKK